MARRSPVVSLLVGTLLLAGCSQQSQILRAPASELHTVDGVTMTAERPCQPARDGDCASWIARARAALKLPASTEVLRVSLAGDGYHYGGFTAPVIIVLDLAGDERRAVRIVCGPWDPVTATPLPSGQEWPCQTLPPS